MKRSTLAILVSLLGAIVSLAGYFNTPPKAAMVAAPVAVAMATPLDDLSTVIPYNPAPWRIEGKTIFDGLGKRVSAGGVSVCGYSNYPKSKAEATAWAKKIAALGVRVYRAHKVDGGFYDNWNSHSQRFQWLLDALEKLGIPVIMEVAATHEYWDYAALSRGELARFQAMADKLATLRLSNVVAMTPVNEPNPTGPEVFQAQYDYLRKAGYKGLIFGSNAMVQGGSYGDFANGHYYCGLESHDPKRFFEIEYKDQPWNHPKVQNLPVVATEIGHFWPASTRYQSEWQIVESLLRIDAQVILMFALIDNVDEWTTAKKPIDKDSFHNDPDRMENLARLVHRMGNVPYQPRTYTPGFKAVFVKGGEWEMKPTAQTAK